MKKAWIIAISFVLVLTVFVPAQAAAVPDDSGDDDPCKSKEHTIDEACEAVGGVIGLIPDRPLPDPCEDEDPEDCIQEIIGPNPAPCDPRRDTPQQCIADAVPVCLDPPPQGPLGFLSCGY